MIFEEIKDSFLNKKINGKKSKKEATPFLNPTSLIRDNGLIVNKLIWQGHNSYVYNGFYHQTVPVIIKFVCRETELTEMNELQILETLKGKKHTVGLFESILKKDYAIFIFQKVIGIPADEILSKSLTIENMRKLLKEVLETLEQAHKMEIVHRDIRLQNILVKPNFEEIYLIGWGCGTKISSKMCCSVGSRSIRSPEMLMGYENYKKKGDVWAIGVLILYIISDGKIPWKADTPKETLIEMAVYFGAQNILDLEKTLHQHIGVKTLQKHVKDMIIPLETTFSPRHANLDNEDLIDLLHKCFTLDFRLRPSVSDLLDHKFFKM